MTTRKIGLLIGGTEEDWPSALEMLFRRFDPIITLPGGEPLRVDIERVRVHPFDLRAGTAYDLSLIHISSSASTTTNTRPSIASTLVP